MDQNGGGRRGTRVYRRYKHFCGPEGGNRVLTVGCADMLSGLLIPLLKTIVKKRCNSNRATRKSATAKETMDLSWKALNKLSNLGLRTHTRFLVRRRMLMEEEDRYTHAAVQSGALEVNSWRADPNQIPEPSARDCRAISGPSSFQLTISGTMSGSLSERAAQRRGRQVEAEKSRHSMATRSQLGDRKLSDLRSQSTTTGKAGFSTGPKGKDPIPRRLRSGNREGCRTAAVPSRALDASVHAQHQFDPPMTHFSRFRVMNHVITFLELEGLEMAVAVEFLAAFRRSTTDRVAGQKYSVDHVMLLSQTGTNRAVEDHILREHSDWVRAVGPRVSGRVCRPYSSNTWLAERSSGGFMVLANPSQSFDLSLLSITPFSSTVALPDIQSTDQRPIVIHVVHFPPTMGRVSNFSLFEALVVPPSPWQPRLILGNLGISPALLCGRRSNQVPSGRLRVLQRLCEAVQLQAVWMSTTDSRDEVQPRGQLCHTAIGMSSIHHAFICPELLCQ